MKQYNGQCHCGAVSFQFEVSAIDKGLRCNCSLCKRKGALMSPFALAPEQLHRDIKDDSLGLYEFGSKIAKHYFCKQCGIYVFHETKRQPGYFRVNLGCIDEIDTFLLPFDVFDGASL